MSQLDPILISVTLVLTLNLCGLSFCVHATVTALSTSGVAVG